MRSWLLALSCLWFTSTAVADGLTAELALFYMNDSSSRSFKNGDEGSFTLKTKTNHTFTALGFCYRLDWACIGLKYVQGSVAERTGDTLATSNTITETYSGPGLTLGASVNEWVAHATFLVGAQKKISNKSSSGDASFTSSTRYPAQSAMLLDLGYGFKVGSVRIGPLVSLLHMDYKKVIAEGSTESLPAKESDDFVLPHIALWVDF